MDLLPLPTQDFVTLVDGMDIAAPLLNFPTGNLVGISGLDVESVELVPGAASALYGPNAFNGILFMNSKSPFEYQGLSAEIKAGATTLRCWRNKPTLHFCNHVMRSRSEINLRSKLISQYLDGTDWAGNDYTTDRVIAGNLPWC